MQDCEHLYNEEKYFEAIDCCLEELDIEQENIFILFVLSKSYWKIDKLDLAIETYDKVIYLDPLQEAAYFGKGIALLELGAQANDEEILKEAILNFNEAIAISPDELKYTYKGKSLFHLGRLSNLKTLLEDSVQSFNRAIKIKPDYHIPKVRKALSLLAIGQDWGENDKLEEAIDLFNNLIKLDFEKSQCYTFKGHALYNLAERTGKRSMINQARIACDQAIFNDPTNHEAHYTKGIFFIDEGWKWKESDKIKEGLMALNMAIELSPFNAHFFKKKGEAIHYLSKFEDEKNNLLEALICINKSVELNTARASAYEIKGSIFADLAYHENPNHNLSEAIAAFTQAIELDTKRAVAHAGRGEALYNLGRLTNKKDDFLQAIESYDQAIKLNNYTPILYGNKGIALNHIGNRWDETNRVEEAIEAFGKAIELDAENASYYAHKGYALYLLGRMLRDRDLINDSIEICDQAILLDPPLAFSYYYKALAYREIGYEWKERKMIVDSIFWFEKAFERNPQVSSERETGIALYLIGAQWEERDKLEEAIKEFDQAPVIDAMEYDPLFRKGNALFSLGSIWKEKNKLVEAVSAFDSSIAINPDLAYSYYQKARTLSYLLQEWNEGSSPDILKNYSRALYLEKESILDPHSFISFVLDNFHAPHLVNRFLSIHPFVKSSSRISHNLEHAEQVYLNHRNRMVRVYKELKPEYSGKALERRFTLYRAIAEYMGGDPIIAFDLHDRVVDRLWEENLQHQYYYVLSAEEILHPDATITLKYAKQYANAYLENEGLDPVQLYYAACIFMLDNDFEMAIELLEQVVSQYNYLPSWFKLLECYDYTGTEVKKKELTKVLHDKHILDQLKNRSKAKQAACLYLDEQIQRFESSTGWYLAGVLVDEHETKLAAANIPLARSIFRETAIVGDQIRYENPTQQEINDIDPERLKRLESRCRDRMEKAFLEYESLTVLNAEELAENLRSIMIDEKKEAGSVQIEDYLDFLAYCVCLEKIDQNDYILISSYLSLKFKVENKVPTKDPIKMFTRILLSQIVGTLVNAAGAVLSGIPINQICLLIVNNSNEEDIIQMNFKYLKKHYNSLSQYKPDELTEALKGNEWLDSIRGSFENIVGF